MSDPLNLVFGALADPNRRQVIGYLSERGTATATELTGELPMTRQAVSKHLSALEQAGLVSVTRRGRETHYHLTPTGLGSAIAWIEHVGAQWDERLAALREHLAATRDAAPRQP